ncbi:rod shape-determining protein MreC [Aequorivita sublithincola DSM 14238]|uniref:Cell shape-determining protein MreC n=1 Tax=Aequorivita sublithincola (strain DSM 14238 / LMG 21431 / ACAM 643 / 9-3) TaxID=746697 RepID=I3YSV3_AEQSU|nr:rod shape-determining protein MreC [Aequorivita sublithincola]AFL80071.1 rod shape-determining protein MreC [Aequorivita sublithincola DSM 14238]
MQQIIFFFIRNKNFLLFAVLFIISVGLTIQTHNYHNDKYISSANYITGGVYTFRNNITDYFSLAKENDQLLQENLILRKKLDLFKETEVFGKLDSTILQNKYEYFTARVINNNYSKTKNQLTLDKGRNDSITIDLGVISSKGIVGIVSDVSENYSTVQSILNTKSRINAKHKKSGHFGSLKWNTEDPNVVQLVDIPRLAPLKKGDTIVTGGRSTIFPEGILIGTVKDFHLDNDDNYYYVNIDLFNNMTSLEHVYLIKNYEAEEIKELEKAVEDEE